MSNEIKRIPFGGGNPLDEKMSKAVIHNNTIYLAGTTAADDVVDRQAGNLCDFYIKKGKKKSEERIQ